MAMSGAGGVDGRTTQAVFSVLLASPSDVEGERTALATNVSEFNLTWSAFLGVHVRLVACETHSRPDLGEYPQEVLNRQLGSNHDAVFGVFWSRLGTPTPRAGSGSEEEIVAALDRRMERRSRWPVVGVYYKSAPIPQDLLDGDRAAARISSPATFPGCA